jgi:hypothetical protein|nr:MAG TPA: hypothetical protein [Caudoviricetes sp.]
MLIFVVYRDPSTIAKSFNLLMSEYKQKLIQIALYVLQKIRGIDFNTWEYLGLMTIAGVYLIKDFFSFCFIKKTEKTYNKIKKREHHKSALI